MTVPRVSHPFRFPLWPFSKGHGLISTFLMPIKLQWVIRPPQRVLPLVTFSPSSFLPLYASFFSLNHGLSLVWSFHWPQPPFPFRLPLPQSCTLPPLSSLLFRPLPIGLYTRPLLPHLSLPCLHCFIAPPLEPGCIPAHCLALPDDRFRPPSFPVGHHSLTAPMYRSYDPPIASHPVRPCLLCCSAPTTQTGVPHSSSIPPTALSSRGPFLPTSIPAFP